MNKSAEIVARFGHPHFRPVGDPLCQPRRRTAAVRNEQTATDLLFTSAVHRSSHQHASSGVFETEPMFLVAKFATNTATHHRNRGFDVRDLRSFGTRNVL